MGEGVEGEEKAEENDDESTAIYTSHCMSIGHFSKCFIQSLSSLQPWKYHIILFFRLEN